MREYSENYETGGSHLGREGFFVCHVQGASGRLAEATGIPLISEVSSGEKEREVDDLERALQRIEVDGVVPGVIESEYQASRVRRVCESLGLEMYAPLWHQDPEMLLREMIKVLDARIVHVSALGFDEGWLGRKIDEPTIEELKVLKERYGRIRVSGGGCAILHKEDCTD